MPDRAEIVPERQLNPEIVRRLCGEITDGAVAAIVASQAKSPTWRPHSRGSTAKAM